MDPSCGLRAGWSHQRWSHPPRRKCKGKGKEVARFKDSSCLFAILRQLRSIRCSVPRSVLQSFCSGWTMVMQRWLAFQPISPSGCSRCWFCCSACIFRITPLLTQLHWLKVLQRIKFKLAVLVYKCLHQTASPYLAEELHQSSADDARQRLRSASTSSLVVPCTRLSASGGRVFPGAAARLWNTSAERHVGVVNVFSGNIWRPISSVQWLRHFGHYNRSCCCCCCYYYFFSVTINLYNLSLRVIVTCSKFQSVYIS